MGGILETGKEGKPLSAAAKGPAEPPDKRFNMEQK